MGPGLLLCSNVEPHEILCHFLEGADLLTRSPLLDRVLAPLHRTQNVFRHRPRFIWGQAAMLTQLHSPRSALLPKLHDVGFGPFDLFAVRSLATGHCSDPEAREVAVPQKHAVTPRRARQRVYGPFGDALVRHQILPVSSPVSTR